MSLETTLLIGILTILAIAVGADCLWSLVIRSSNPQAPKFIYGVNLKSAIINSSIP